MKYSCSVEINKSMYEVIELWENEDNFHYWQDGFERIDLISGTKNSVGAVSKILIVQGKMKIALEETLLVYNLPQEKSARYVHKHMTNIQTTRFEKVNETTTRYISEVEYTQFNGLTLKIMAKLFPRKFKEQSQKWMIQFKDFAEK